MNISMPRLCIRISKANGKGQKNVAIFLKTCYNTEKGISI